MKTNTYKYLSLVSVTLMSILMLFDWFTIEAVGTVESHSFITIPSMLITGASFLTQLAGKMVVAVSLIMAASLEYLCILSAILGLWGSIRTFLNKRKSRLWYIAQVLALFLISIAFIAILLINVLSKTMLGDIVSVVPTFWFILSMIILALSFWASSKYTEDFVED